MLLTAAGASAALLRTYQVRAVDSPNPTPGGDFGIGSIDHTSDGSDFLEHQRVAYRPVPPAPPTPAPQTSQAPPDTPMHHRLPNVR